MLAVLFMILALSRKENRYLFAAAAGVAMIGEAYTWLGSSAYFGVFLIYAVIQITLDLKNGKSSSNTVKTMLVHSFQIRRAMKKHASKVIHC